MLEIPDCLAELTMLSWAEIGLALALLGNKIATAIIQTKGIAIVCRKSWTLLCLVEIDRIDILNQVVFAINDSSNIE